MSSCAQSRADGTWQTRWRTNGQPGDTYRARDLWNKLGRSAWACADPGVQYDTTINDWHTCPNTGRINASNPCSEYMFLDDTACNLASLNLTKFLTDQPDGSLSFDVDGYRHAARVFFIAQEILVDLSSYPTRAIARNSHDYRPLGLGYANLGTMLMLMGVPYDSDRGRGHRGVAHRDSHGSRLSHLRWLACSEGSVCGVRAQSRTDAASDAEALRCRVCAVRSGLSFGTARGGA